MRYLYEIFQNIAENNKYIYQDSFIKIYVIVVVMFIVINFERIE